MPGPGTQPAARWARRVESYEVKCERRQEARESRRRRPNLTTCRPASWRAQHHEQLQKARQYQFCQRRNLAPEEPGRAPQPPPQGQALPTKPVPGALQKQVAGMDTAVSIVAGIRRDPTSRLSDPAGAPPTEHRPSQKPSQHRGTQTQPQRAWSAMKNDASQQTNLGVAVLDQEILQLSDYLKEALQRELVLKKKMVLLQDLLSTLLHASDSSWKGQLNEDKLKGKLRTLENQLHTCTQKYSPCGVKRVLLEMEDQKSNYEQKAKESLQKLLEEKMRAEQELQSTQLSLALAEQKCEEWQRQYEALKEDWSCLGTRCRELESQLHVLQSKLQGAHSRDVQLSQALSLLEGEHQELQARIESLQEDRAPGIGTQPLHLQEQLDRAEEEKRVLATELRQLQSLLQSQSCQLQQQDKLSNEKDQSSAVWSSSPSNHEAESERAGEERDWGLRDQLQKKTLQLQAKEEESRELRAELDDLSEEYLSCLHKLQHCREELSQGRQPPRRSLCCWWLPMLTALIVAALAVLLALENNLLN